MTALREDFLDANVWADLARARGLRLPHWSRPVTTGGMRQWLRKLGVSVEQYLADNRARTLRDFHEMNPDWPLRAWVGLLLENLDIEVYIPEPEPEEIPIKRKRGRPRKEVANV